LGAAVKDRESQLDCICGDLTVNNIDEMLELFYLIAVHPFFERPETTKENFGISICPITCDERGMRPREEVKEIKGR
jgi:hypothetical protein